MNPKRDVERQIHDYVETASVSEAVKDYARNAFKRGTDYADAYVGRLGLSGRRVLDAGCGVGNWSIALASRFSEVHALELNAERLELATGLTRHAYKNVYPLRGSIESLPYGDGSFDAIFCNGVIFLTDWQRGLSEFYRVLAPGGLLYLTYNTTKWPAHLIYDRSEAEPHLRAMACEISLSFCVNTLRSLGFANLDEGLKRQTVSFLFPQVRMNDLEGGRFRLEESRLACLWNLLVSLRRLASRLWNARLEDDRFSAMYSSPTITGQFWVEHIRTIVAIRRSIGLVLKYGKKTQRQRLTEIFRSMLEGKDTAFVPTTSEKSIEPEQMSEGLAAAGLKLMADTSEGLLALSSGETLKETIYNHDWGVRELLARKFMMFEPQTEWLCAESFRSNARLASTRFSGIIVDPVVANVSLADDLIPTISRLHLKVAQRFENTDLLERLVAEVNEGCDDRDAGFLRLYRFIQDAHFHHPVIELRNADNTVVNDPLAILLAGIGRCGHVAAVSQSLFSILGYEARVVQLHRHVCCEVKFGGEWRIVDADAFKAGLYPKREDGAWASLDDIRRNPVLIDMVPAIGLQLSPSGPWSCTIDNIAVTGYVDTGLAWDRPYLSYLYQGGEIRFPPAPPGVNAVRQKNNWRLTFDSAAGSLAAMNIRVDHRTRGWSYEDYPDERYLEFPAGSVVSMDIDMALATDGVEIEASERPLFVSLMVRDEYQLANPEIYVWPGPEIELV